jgi:hypothetical protein
MTVEHLKNDTYQVIDEATASVVFQGSQEDCELVMYAEEEAKLREEFILMMS